ncbi:TPA: DUF3265 domain-containing protein [Vibrio parahaemolyticus]|nr:DUF3265 domain-containing protein [Vibrio parahaemolyticus]
MTNNLRVIQHAWHFWYAVVLGVESGLRRLGHCVLHTLIGRYNSFVISSLLLRSKEG